MSQPDETCSTLESIPGDVLSHVVSFLYISSRVKLAACSKRMRDRVYGKECTLCWEIISFDYEDGLEYDHHYFKTYVDRITSSQLSSLLSKVNAVKVTKKLDISDCELIREPSALQPLEGSKVLEQLNLDITEAANPAPFLDFFRTMIPFEFHRFSRYQTRVSRTATREQTEAYSEFMLEFRLAKFNQALQNREICSECKDPLVTRAMLNQPGVHGAPALRCAECDAKLCRSGHCQGEVFDCMECGDVFCHRCGPRVAILRCSTCPRVVCSPSSCWPPAHDQFGFCDACKQGFCGDCAGRVQPCPHCGTPYCTSCITSSMSRAQNGCMVCRYCALTCSVCNDSLCKFCSTNIKTCPSCEAIFCGGCASSLHVECGACGTARCVVRCARPTDFTHCGGCDRHYCKKHNRIVDCAACAMRHCYLCEAGRGPCESCLRPCHEPCVCEEVADAEE